MLKTDKRVEHAWSDRHALDYARLFPPEPGVYRLLALRDSAAAPIPRLLATDPDGVLYVGKAARLRGRVRTLVKCIREDVRGHAAGRRFHHIDRLRARAGLDKFSDTFELRLSFFTCNSVEDAKSAETQVLHAYIAQYGEVPPLNGQGDWSGIA